MTTFFKFQVRVMPQVGRGPSGLDDLRVPSYVWVFNFSFGRLIFFESDRMRMGTQGTY